MKNVPSSADVTLVNCLSGNTKWIQHGTMLADWKNTRTDNAAAVADQQLLGQPFHDFSRCFSFIAIVDLQATLFDKKDNPLPGTVELTKGRHYRRTFGPIFS